MAQKILIIDDDIDTLKLVGIMLERKGFEIQASTTGKKGLRTAKEEIPDLILLDVMIPDLDGYQIARDLRATPETESIPIIMFTAKSQVDDKVEGLEAGADAYITKPARPRELFAQVNSILKRAPQRTPASQAAQEPEGELIGILSAKGGLGVSTLAINLAIELHNQSNQKVILSDFRPGQGTIAIDLDIQRSQTMDRLLEESGPDQIGSKIADSLLDHKSGIKTFLSSYQPKDAQFITAGDVFRKLAGELGILAPYTVLDLGPGLTPIHTEVAPECSRLLICLEPTPMNIIQTRALFQDLINLGIGEGLFVSVLINRQRSGVQLSLDQAADQLGREIDHVFSPVPELAYQASRTHVPMVERSPDSLTAEQFGKLAASLLE
jgi:pilus assembly protein CpaE